MKKIFDFPQASPEDMGVSSDVLLHFVNDLSQKKYVHSIILLRHGVKIVEGYFKPYNQNSPHRLFSLTKSFTSVAIGMAKEEKLLSLNDPVVKFFPDKKIESTSCYWEQLTIRNLLTMSTGHENVPFSLSEFDFVQKFFDMPLEYRPGTHFYYNSLASHTLPAILQRVSGKTLSQYLKPRLFEPLEFRNWRMDCAPDGVDCGGWGGWMRSGDIAKFAQCLLQKGHWQGQQLIPRAYLDEATSFQVDNSNNNLPDWKIGYGYQFWRSQHNSFRGDGACGQYALVMPEQDMVLAVTSGLSNMQLVLDSVWKILLPGVYASPRPPAPRQYGQLTRMLEMLELPVAQGALEQRPDPSAYDMDENASGIKHIQFSFQKNNLEMIFDGPHGKEKMVAGFGFSCDNTTRLWGAPLKIAASAAWRTTKILEVILLFYETPYRDILSFEFKNADLFVTRSCHIQFMHPDWTIMRGKKTAAAFL